MANTTQAMTRRERVLAAMRRQPVDRIATDIWATPEVFEALHGHFGGPELMREALHLDGITHLFPPFRGTLQKAPPGEHVDFWGMRFKQVSYGSGSYMEQISTPMAEIQSLDDLSRFQWANLDDFDHDALRPKVADAVKTECVMIGYMSPFLLHNQLRGLEQSLMDPLEDPELAHAIIGGICDWLIEHHRRMFEACDGLGDITQVTDDYGSQHGPMISLDIFREFYLPHLKRMIDLAKSHGIMVMHHDDGAMSDFLPDLVDAGIDVLNPIQWRCPGMEPQRLKEGFGERIAFHGGLDNQETLPHGSTDDVRRETRWLIDTLATDGTGYVFAPCHNIQPVTPIENILAMYDEAYHYGQFT
jgi:uroporphyrinogen decarboxylase